MGYKPGVRKCAHSKCRKSFKKRVREQIYCDKRCRDAAAQERLRERARKFGEMSAEIHGAIGAAK